MKIDLWSRSAPEQFALELEQDGGIASVLRLVVAGDSAKVRLDRTNAVPEALLVAANPGLRLMTLAEVRQLAATKADQAALQLEAQWHALVEALSTASLHAAMASRFVGITPFPGGALAYQGTVKLNLNACLVDSAVGLEALIAVAADCQVAHAGAALTVRVAWRLSVSAAAAWPRLSIHLPGPGLRFPDFDFPAFNPGALNFPAIPNFDLALPSLPGIARSLSHGGVTLTPIVYTPGTGALQFGVTLADAVLTLFDQTCNFGSPTLSFDNGAITIDDFEAGPFTGHWTPRAPARLPAPLDDVSQELGSGSLTFALAVDGNIAVLKGVLEQTLTLFPTLQPDKRLTLKLTLPFEGDALTGDVTIGGVRTEREVAIVIDHVAQVLGALLQNLSLPGSVSVNLSLPMRIDVAGATPVGRLARLPLAMPLPFARAALPGGAVSGAAAPGRLLNPACKWSRSSFPAAHPNVR